MSAWVPEPVVVYRESSVFKSYAIILYFNLPREVDLVFAPRLMTSAEVSSDSASGVRTGVDNCGRSDG